MVKGVDVETQEVSRLERADLPASFTRLPKGDSPDTKYHPRWYGIVRTSVGMYNHFGPLGADNPLLLVRRTAQLPARRLLALGAMERAVRIAHEEPVRLNG